MQNYILDHIVKQVKTTNKNISEAELLAIIDEAVTWARQSQCV